MEKPNATQNPERGNCGHADEDFDGLGNRRTTKYTSEITGDSHPESSALGLHSSSPVHINPARPTIEELQFQNDDLRRRNKALEDRVAQYHVAHLRELPEDHITDATAQRLYEGIQDAIEQWVYNVTGRLPAVDWLNRYEKRLHASIQDPKAGKLSAIFEYIPRFFKDPKKCKASESIDCLFLSWLIAHSLAMYIFSKPYPIGIDGDQADFLDHAIEAMRGPGCHYDENHIDKWRTQTLAILMGHPDFGKNQKQVLDTIYEKMCSHLLQWLPREDVFKEHEEQFKEAIFREAVTLQQKMGLAADDYQIVVDTFDPRSAPHRKVTYRNPFTFRPIDAQDVRYPFYGCLFPSLCRIDFGGESHYITEPVFIAVPTLSQSLHQPVEPKKKLRGKSFTEPTTKSNEWFPGVSRRNTDTDLGNSQRRHSGLLDLTRTD